MLGIWRRWGRLRGSVSRLGLEGWDEGDGWMDGGEWNEGVYLRNKQFYALVSALRHCTEMRLIVMLCPLDEAMIAQLPVQSLHSKHDHVTIQSKAHDASVKAAPTLGHC